MVHKVAIYHIRGVDIMVIHLKKVDFNACEQCMILHNYIRGHMFKNIHKKQYYWNQLASTNFDCHIITVSKKVIQNLYPASRFRLLRIIIIPLSLGIRNMFRSRFKLI